MRGVGAMMMVLMLMIVWFLVVVRMTYARMKAQR